MSRSVRRRKAIDSEDQMMMPKAHAGHVQIVCVEKEDLIRCRAEKVTYTYDSPFMNVYYHLGNREFELLSVWMRLFNVRKQLEMRKMKLSNLLLCESCSRQKIANPRLPNEWQLS